MAKTKKEKLECRIRYVEDWCGNGEHFVFENKWPDDEEWGLDSAFPVCEIKDGELAVGHGNGTLVNYTALTKIRELLNMGVSVRFGK